MKNKNLIKFTIIGMLICIVVFYLFLILDLNFLLLAVYFVIPFGGPLFGAIIGSLARIGLTKDKTSCGEGKQLLFALVLVLFLFFLTLLDYGTCYVSNGEISRFFAGEHISKIGSGWSFGQYFNSVYVNSELNISVHHNDVGTTGDTGFSLIIYFLQYLGIIAFGLGILSAGMDEKSVENRI